MSTSERSTHINVPEPTSSRQHEQSSNDAAISVNEEDQRIALDAFEDTLPLAGEDPEPREDEDGNKYDPLHTKLRTANFALAHAGSSILIVGATGLVGSRLVKFIKRVKTDNQVIFVLARRPCVEECDGVVVNIVDSPGWGAEIAKIPNLTTVYCALGSRPPENASYMSEGLLPINDYYQTNHNIVYQVALAAKIAGAKRFIYTSHHAVQSPLFRLLDRRTKMRRELENDIIGLDFENVTILRPGPLVGLRLKAGSLTGINWISIPQGLYNLALSPFYFTSPFTPLTFVNFGTSVGKTGAMLLKTESTNKVNYIYPCQIMLGATAYNAFRSERLMISGYNFLQSFTNDDDDDEPAANEGEPSDGKRQQ